MAFVIALLSDEFKREVDKDTEFGLKAALEAKIIDPDRASTLSNDQKQLFNNYGLLRLLGCKVGQYSEGSGLLRERDLQVEKVVEHQDVSPYEEIPPAVTLDRFLELSAKEAQVFEDENIFELVDSEILSFERALTLTEQEFERLRVKTWEERDPQGDQRKQNYDLVFRTGGVKAESVLEFLTTIPEDYWPDPYFVKQVFEKTQDIELDPEHGVLAIASLPVSHLDALAKYRQDEDLLVLNGVISLTQPITGIPFNEEATNETERPILRPVQLSIQQLKNYTPDQIVSIGLADNGIKVGLITVEEACSLTIEQAQVADVLGNITLWAPDEDIEEVTNGQVSKEDIYDLSVKEACALSILSFLLKEELATADQIKALAERANLVGMIEDNYQIMIEFFRENPDSAMELLSDLDDRDVTSLCVMLDNNGRSGMRKVSEKVKDICAVLFRNNDQAPEVGSGPV